MRQFEANPAYYILFVKTGLNAHAELFRMHQPGL